MDSSASCCAPHAVVFPLPYQGHVIPALQFAFQLTSRGTTVTFVNTERNHERIIHSHPVAGYPHEKTARIGIRFVTIPDGLPPEPDVVPDAAPLDRALNENPGAAPATDPVLQSLGKQGPALERLIKDLETTGSRVCCLISDPFMPWTGEVAQKLKIPWAAFWTCSATWLSLTSFVSKHGVVNTESEASAVIPGLPLSSAHMASIPPTPERIVLQVQARMKAMENANCILVNSFDEIEGEILAAVPSNVPIWSIGPLILGAASGSDRFHGSLLKPDEDCLPWLDRQQTGSVLYISFGSQPSLMSAAQLAELARGIEASQKPFLWVERGLEQLPEGFRQRVEGVGRVVPWAPQLDVLRHRSVGAFLTHCGWNSILEAMASAVPMACWPLRADQLSNRVLVEEQWRVGRGWSPCEGKELVHASHVSMVVKEVMNDEELKQRAELLAQASKRAMLPAGSSYLNVQAFLTYMHSSSAK